MLTENTQCFKSTENHVIVVAFNKKYKEENTKCTINYELYYYYYYNY